MTLQYQMLRIRRIEERIALEYPKQEMRCPIHLSLGQEAAAVAVCASLTKNDLMVSTHRGHAHYLAKGGNLNRFIAELYGKESGCSKGQGGSMHLVDWSCGFAGSTSIVGGTIPIGCGLAFANKLKGKDDIVVVCIGDAAIEEGVFHEAANFSSLHQLRVLFIVENNLFSCYTHINDRQPKRPLKHVGNAHRIISSSVDGNSVTKAASRVQRMVKSMKQYGGPRLLEMTTYRLVEHCGPNNDDHLGYRNLHTTHSFEKTDPVKKIRSEEYEAHIKKEIDEAFEFAKSSPFPPQSDLGRFLYAQD